MNVYEQGNKVFVIINTPVLITENKRYQWAVRVLDKNLYLRGQMDIEESGRNENSAFYSERRSEQIMKVIPLPAYVKRKPSSVNFEHEWVTIVLDKQDTVPTEEEWHALNFSKK